MSRFKFGIFAEMIACILYKLSLYKIIGHRVRHYLGEIDLICMRGKKLVFVEVKARNTNIYEGIVSHHQQQRIRKSAEIFLSKNSKYQGYDVRFDLVFIQPFSFPQVIRNVW